MFAHIPLTELLVSDFQPSALFKIDSSQFEFGLKTGIHYQSPISLPRNNLASLALEMADASFNSRPPTTPPVGIISGPVVQSILINLSTSGYSKTQKGRFADTIARSDWALTASFSRALNGMSTPL